MPGPVESKQIACVSKPLPSFTPHYSQYTFSWQAIFKTSLSTSHRLVGPSQEFGWKTVLFGIVFQKVFEFECVWGERGILSLILLASTVGPWDSSRTPAPPWRNLAEFQRLCELLLLMVQLPCPSHMVTLLTVQPAQASLPLGSPTARRLLPSYSIYRVWVSVTSVHVSYQACTWGGTARAASHLANFGLAHSTQTSALDTSGIQ